MKKLILVSVFFAAILSSCNSGKSSATENVTEEVSNPSSLEGAWELDYISGPKIAFEGLYPDKKPFVSFNIKDGRVSGNNGCNSFTGNVRINKNTIAFDDSMAMTRMFCPGNGESAFMDGLKKVNTYAVTDDGKTLNFIAGDIAIMRFQKK